MFTLRSGRVPYTTWLQQQLLNESFGANIHVHPSAVPMAPGLAPQMVPMQPCGLMSPHPMHMPVGPVPQAVFQQQEAVPMPPWRADTSPSFLAATNAPVPADHGVGHGAMPADAPAAEIPKTDDKNWWWDGQKYRPWSRGSGAKQGSAYARCNVCRKICFVFRTSTLRTATVKHCRNRACSRNGGKDTGEKD